MSGGISNVYVNNLVVTHAYAGVRIKTARGRGGYVKDVYVSDIVISNSKVAIELTGLYGEHPDSDYDPDALPDVERIVIENVVGTNITLAGNFQGLSDLPFRGIYLSDVFVNATSSGPMWNCMYVVGYSESVFPEPCPELEQDPLNIPCFFINDSNTRSNCDEL